MKSTRDYNSLAKWMTLLDQNGSKFFLKMQHKGVRGASTDMFEMSGEHDGKRFTAIEHNLPRFIKTLDEELERVGLLHYG